jgi:hypothetical protein
VEVSPGVDSLQPKSRMDGEYEASRGCRKTAMARVTSNSSP